MKLKKITSLVLSVLMIASAFIFTASAQAADLVLDYTKIQSGVCDHRDTGTVEVTNDSVQGKVVQFTINPAAQDMDYITIDGTGIATQNVDITKYRYMHIDMKFTSSKLSEVTPSMRFLFTTEGTFEGMPRINLTPALKADGKWHTLTVDMSSLADITPAGVLKHVQFSVGGREHQADAFGAGDTICVGRFVLSNTANGKSENDGVSSETEASTSAPATPIGPSADDVVLDYTKIQRGICDNKDTGTINIVEDSAAGKAVSFKINPKAQQQDYITIDGYGAESFNIDIKKYKYMHIEMKFTSSKLSSINPAMRFLSTPDGNIDGLPYLEATPALKADGKWQTVSIDMSVLAGKYQGSSIMKHLQFSVGGRKYMAESFGDGDEICVSKIVLSNNARFASEATGTGSVSSEAAGPAFDAADKVLDYTKMQRGICDHKDTGEINVADGVVTFIINNQPQNNDYITIDGYGINEFGLDIAKYKYMVVDMKFDSSSIDEIYPTMRFLSTANGGVNGAPYLKSTDPLPADGQWHKVVINMYSGLESTNAINGDSVVMAHIQFSVGGRDYKATNFSAGDSISVKNITLTNENPNKDRVFEVKFKNDFSLAEGTAPETIHGKTGTKFTVPEIPFTADGYYAVGWMVGSSSNDIVAPGAEMVIGENNLDFSVVWKEKIEAKEFISIDYAPYFNGICDHVDTATAEIISFNGKPVVEVIPNPATTSTRGEAINLDGWSYGSANINLSLYKTLLIEYLYLSDNPVQGNAKFNIMARNFSGGVYTVAREPIVEGRWAIASFDMTQAEPKFISTAEPKIMQAHIYPFGDASVKTMSADDRLYVGKIIAIPEVVTSAVEHSSFINGYTDGTFGVNGNMTRAEACTIVARLAAAGDANVPVDLETAFTDVAKDQWYHKYISYVESLGYLKSYSGEFLPNQNITRAEFVELVYNMGLLQDAGKNGTFTDVPADHVRANVIAAAGKAGLVNGYANGDGTFSFKPDATITRAEVVKVINNAYGKKPSADGIMESAKTKFTDVTPDHWAFADIIDAAVSHISYVDAEGKEVWKYIDDSQLSTDGFVADFEGGAKALAEYNALFDKRAEEVKNTPNMDLSGITGKKLFVSSSAGDDKNDGLSEATPLKTIAAATQKATRGDAILLKRGDTWRERIKTIGVIYTAYGEGPKPVINFNLHGDVADESLWTLVDGTTNIWKYAKNIPDVGNIIVNGNKTITKFVSGVKYDNDAMLVGAAHINPAVHLNEDNYFVCVYDSVNGKSATLDKSTLYVRCDAGNPGKVYDSIELAYRGSGISAVSNTTMDNIAIFYAGSHGIGMGTVTNVKFTNMEIGWIGGSAQNTTNGTMTRFGNGIEVYGGCDNYVIDNCYVYQCYDAGITNQKQLGGNDECVEKNVWFTNNVIDRCIYNIEYFMGKADKDGVTRLMENIYYENNLLARSGYGWGMGPSRSASIKGWDHHNNHAVNFNIKNNIFIMDRVNAIDAGYGNVAWMPDLEGNTYIQKYGNTFMKLGANGATQFLFDGTAASALEKVLGENGAKLYYVDKSTVVEEIK